MSKNDRFEYDAFQSFLHGKPLGLRTTATLAARSLPSIPDALVRSLPGPVGMRVREMYFRPRLSHLGEKTLIDVGVHLLGPRNISISDYCWIDAGVRLEALLGPITIGRRVHIAPGSILAAREPVVLGDYVGLSANVKIYANSERPIDGKRMSGPMIPEEFKAFVSKPVTLERDSFVGANSVLLPGAHLGEGAVVGANSVISKPIEPWTIVVGTGRVVGTRSPVTVPDL